MNQTAIFTLILGLAAGTIGGYYLRALRDYFRRLLAQLEDARYPKQRTYADKYRLEDMWASTDMVIDDLELMELHTRQENERKLREIQALRKRLTDVSGRIADARRSAPGEYPEQAFPFNGEAGDE